MTTTVLQTTRQAETRSASVAVIIVARDRPRELEKTLAAVLSQNTAIGFSVLVVDSSIHPLRDNNDLATRISRIPSAVNLGGAGGFALGILQSIAAGAEWLWLMDDDGRPHGDDVLAGLMVRAQAHDLDAIAPVVLDVDDPARFAFPYPVNRRYVFERDGLPPDMLIPSMAHLFNGLLIRSSAIFKIGLPDLRLFTRGDEIDFLHRMQRQKLRFATTTSVSFEHPSSNHELFPIFSGRLHVVYPAAAWKRRTQYRNRGYNFLRRRQFIVLAIDFVRYPYFFLMIRRGDFKGLGEWARCMWQGMRGDVHVEPTVDLTPRKPWHLR